MVRTPLSVRSQVTYRMEAHKALRHLLVAMHMHPDLSRLGTGSLDPQTIRRQQSRMQRRGEIDSDSDRVEEGQPDSQQTQTPSDTGRGSTMERSGMGCSS